MNAVVQFVRIIESVPGDHFRNDAKMIADPPRATVALLVNVSRPGIYAVSVEVAGGRTLVEVEPVSV
jgi:hypothetical protein